MKWMRRVLIAALALVFVLAGVLYFSALRTENRVGFQGVEAKDKNGRAFTVVVWYPTTARTWPAFFGPMLMDVARNAPVAGRALPLVVISHGNGGGPLGHADLAMALANAGYVVAAPMHIGDNVADQSAVGTASFISGRNQQLRATVDHMLENWQGRGLIDQRRIGAFGFSMGGFTVLNAVGARPDLRRIATHCAAAPEFACEVLGHFKSPLLKADMPVIGEALVPDPRIKAAVVAAPGFGFAMAPDGLADVSVPVQLWSADKDEGVPYATNAKIVRDALGAKVEFHSVPGASHFSFLAPCSLLMPPLPMCKDPGEFDRKAFHATMNASVVAFFHTNMKPSGAAGK
ncbi:alpha/beta hydrolase family protein [Massilia glaciei]|uniref:Dienelactone hydrolase n=1 Tax=Massilia glaciei TaxID=1524097 RepID=A0A2U2HET1_9BURK|nr:dienelactone hydrolase family protein [Massilia glaciei]PWF42426.1 dienelactone hydrolase [Massilia glaciei]